jgi:hypothetical protein
MTIASMHSGGLYPVLRFSVRASNSHNFSGPVFKRTIIWAVLFYHNPSVSVSHLQESETHTCDSKTACSVFFPSKPQGRHESIMLCCTCHSSHCCGGCSLHKSSNQAPQRMAQRSVHDTSTCDDPKTLSLCAHIQQQTSPHWVKEKHNNTFQ